MSNDSRAAVLTRVAGGDPKAFEELYRSLEGPLYGFVRLKLNGTSEVDDIVSETLLEVWRSAARFEGRSSVKSWVFGIAYRKTVDVIRKRQRTVVTDDVPETPDVSSEGAICLQKQQNEVLLLNAIEQLKDDQKVVLRLVFFEEMTYREVAEVISKPEGTVKTRVFHAKQALLHALNRRLNATDLIC